MFRSFDLVTTVQSHANGGFSFGVTATRTGRLRGADGRRRVAEQATVRIRPVLTASFTGLSLVGRVEAARPAASGRSRDARSSPSRATAGRSRSTLKARLREVVSARLPLGRLHVRSRSRPPATQPSNRRCRGRWSRRDSRLGARGPAVRFLERRLRSLGYVLQPRQQALRLGRDRGAVRPSEDPGLSRTGVMTHAVSRSLRRRAPRWPPSRAGTTSRWTRPARSCSRSGVAASSASSTCPPARRERPARPLAGVPAAPGCNSVSMYYSMYFIGRFAMHLPLRPALSHKPRFVRLPIWFAPKLYAHSGHGTIVWVLPTTSRSSASLAPRPEPSPGCRHRAQPPVGP